MVEQMKHYDDTFIYQMDKIRKNRIRDARDSKTDFITIATCRGDTML